MSKYHISETGSTKNKINYFFIVVDKRENIYSVNEISYLISIHLQNNLNFSTRLKKMDIIEMLCYRIQTFFTNVTQTYMLFVQSFSDIFDSTKFYYSLPHFVLHLHI